MVRGRFIGVVYFILSAISATSLAGPETGARNVQFLNPGTITLSANYNQTYSYSLTQLLTNPSAPNLRWSSSGLPSWLSLDLHTGLLSGTPPLSSVGTNTFKVSVADGESGDLNHPFQLIVSAPPVWDGPLNLGSATVGQPFTFNVSSHVTNPTGTGTITYSATGLPSWLTLNPLTGVLSGTPGPGDIGPINVTITASISGQGTSSDPGTGTVVVAPPYWTANPITLPDGDDQHAYSQAVAKYAVNPEGTPMTYSKVSGPAWASVSTDGTISGTPAISDDGAVSLTVQFSTTIAGTTYTPSTVFKFNINHIKRPPSWSQNPVVLPPATVGQPYTFNLNTVVTDPEGGTPSFSATGLPSWLTLNSSTGVLSGTPPANAGGDFSGISFTATASGGSSNVAGQGTVNIVPPSWKANPISLTNATDAAAYSQDVTQYAVNPEGTPMTYSKVSGPAWVNVSPTGVLSGSPAISDDGAVSVTVQFTTTILGKTYTPTTVFNFTVTHVKRPPSWSQNPVLINATIGQPFTLNLSTLATDPEGGTIAFTATGLPAWLTLTPAGVLSGTPGAGDIGPLSGITFTATASGGSTNAAGQGKVAIIPPSWTANPITLPDGNDASAYSQSVAQYAVNPEQTPMVFSKVSGPAWATVSSTGVISGSPAKPDDGAVSLTVQFSTTIAGTTYTPSTVFQFNVNHVKHPPSFTQNPVILPPATVGLPYTFNLNTVATDPEGGTISFTATGLPAWLTLNNNGTLTGTPALSDAGAFTGITFTATASGGSASASGQGTVQVVYPVWSSSVVNLGTATVGQPFTFDLKPYVTNPLGSGGMTFSAVGLPAWLSLNSSTGVLSGTPGVGDLGTVVIPSITATIAGQGSASVSAQGVVVPAAPHWTGNPITLADASDGSAYSQSVTAYAVNPEGTPMTYSKVSGPAWASVSASGVISGTPAKTDDGPVSLTVQFSTTISGTTYTPSTVFQFNVQHVKKPPVWSQNPVVLPPATVGQAYTFNLGTLATDPEGGTITYSATGLPSWLTLAPNGVLSGTPALANVGSFSGITFTATASGGSTSASGQGSVGIVAPKWKTNPITIGNATVGSAYNQDVTGYVNNPSGAALTYTKVSGPAWVSVSADGRISGTPAAGDVGPVAVGVALSTTVAGQTYTDNTTFDFNVVQPLLPPHWSVTSVDLGTQYTGKPFSFDLKTVATDPQGGALTFSATGLPSWMTLSSNGVLSGTPADKDVGSYSGIVFTATGVGGSSTANGFGVVKQTIVAPKWIATPITLANATPGTMYSQDLTQYVLNPSHLPVTFTILSLPFPPAWVSVGAASGAMTGTPQAADKGAVAVTVMLQAVVAGQTVQDTALFKFSVMDQGKPPVWSQSPITMSATVNQPFSNSLTAYASDPAGLTLTFSKASGPGWLNVADNGALSGTPSDADLGLGKFDVKVCNTIPLCASAQLNINVTSSGPSQTDTTQVDAPVDGAPAENLWAIGNYRTSTCLMEKVCQAIHVYYDDLNRAGIHHSGVMISADGKKGGNPIATGGQSLLMTWDESDIVSDYKARLDATYVSGWSAYRDNSPIWSMFGFYTQLPSLTSIYQKGYFMSQVPSDTMIITEDGDAYEDFASGTPQEGWDPTKWAGDFTRRNEQSQKPFRISVLATQCGSQEEETREIDGMPSGGAAASKTYDQLVAATQGKFYNGNQSESYVEQAFHDYASKVIFRAYVNAKHQIKLSKTPSDPSKIQVTIAGAAVDVTKWSYDSATNSVNIRWDLVGDQGLKPGDTISITYPTSGRLASVR